MKTIIPICLVLAVGFCSCYKFSVGKGGNTDSIVSQPQSNSVVDLIIEDSVDFSDNLSPFKCVVDTLNSAGDRLVHSEYFLYDITGDGNPELWVRSGTCEADLALWVYSSEKGKVRKIFSDYGGHTDYFLNGNTIGSITCNTGAGNVSIYRYSRGRIKVKTAEFSMWNEEGEARAVKKKEQSIIDIWESSNYGITFNPLK